MNKIKTLLIMGLGMGLGAAGIAYAQSNQGATNAAQISISSTDALFCLIDQLFDFLFYLLIALSVIMIIWAAYNYLTAQDNSERVTKATKTLTYVAVAVAVALIAKGFPILIGDIFSAQITSQTSGCSY